MSGEIYPVSEFSFNHYCASLVNVILEITIPLCET